MRRCVVALLALGLLAPLSAQQQPQRADVRPSATVTAQSYPAEQVQRGQAAFAARCGFCHGRDAAGGESGPDLTRSTLVTEDVRGDKIASARPHRPRRIGACPPFALPDADVAAIVAFIHDRRRRQSRRREARRSVDPPISRRATRGRPAVFRRSRRLHDVSLGDRRFAGVATACRACRCCSGCSTGRPTGTARAARRRDGHAAVRRDRRGHARVSRRIHDCACRRVGSVPFVASVNGQSGGRQPARCAQQAARHVHRRSDARRAGVSADAALAADSPHESHACRSVCVAAEGHRTRPRCCSIRPQTAGPRITVTTLADGTAR